MVFLFLLLYLSVQRYHSIGFSLSLTLSLCPKVPQYWFFSFSYFISLSRYWYHSFSMSVLPSKMYQSSFTPQFFFERILLMNFFLSITRHFILLCINLLCFFPFARCCYHELLEKTPILRCSFQFRIYRQKFMTYNPPYTAMRSKN